MRKGEKIMNEAIQAVISVLTARHIDYTLVEHIPVYTIDEMAALHLPGSDAVAKNLFVRDDKKRNYYVIVVHQEKTVNLKALRERLGTRPLSFASEADLWNYLKLRKGAVTPLGVLNDETHTVTVVIDKVFTDNQIAVHPNDNTTSLWLQTADLISLIQEHGNPVVVSDI